MHHEQQLGLLMFSMNQLCSCKSSPSLGLLFSLAGYTAGTPYKVPPTQSNNAPPPYSPSPNPYQTAMYPIRSAYPQQNLYTQVGASPPTTSPHSVQIQPEVPTGLHLWLSGLSTHVLVGWRCSWWGLVHLWGAGVSLLTAPLDPLDETWSYVVVGV